MIITVSVVTCVVNIVESFIHRKAQLEVVNQIYEITDELSLKHPDKFFRLKCKMIVLVPTFAIMNGIWLYGLFEIFGVDALVLLYFNSFVTLRSAQFYVISDAMKIKLEIINEDLLVLLATENEKYLKSSMLVRAKMEKIRKDYLYLKDMSNVMNDCGAWSSLSLLLLFTSFLIVVTYWFLLSLVKDIFTLKPYQSICYIILTCLMLALASHPCTQCAALVKSFNVFL